MGAPLSNQPPPGERGSGHDIQPTHKKETEATRSPATNKTAATSKGVFGQENKESESNKAISAGPISELTGPQAAAAMEVRWKERQARAYKHNPGLVQLNTFLEQERGGRKERAFITLEDLADILFENIPIKNVIALGQGSYKIELAKDHSHKALRFNKEIKISLEDTKESLNVKVEGIRIKKLLTSFPLPNFSISHGKDIARDNNWWDNKVTVSSLILSRDRSSACSELSYYMTQ
ncbi:MAG: hypothetical protein LLG04_10375 [Parachlamydia sp.]|nr:hypothetical protein [Parachlamydia sp.]